jgi:hypothetical protein
MSAVTQAVRVVVPGNRFSQSVRDSLVMAKRNLVRMTRIPNLVRPSRPGFISPGIGNRRLNALKGEAK